MNMPINAKRNCTYSTFCCSSPVLSLVSNDDVSSTEMYIAKAGSGMKSTPYSGEESDYLVSPYLIF